MSEATCVVCHQQRSAVGALCRECARELRGPSLTPEQLVWRGSATANVGVVDVWGRVYRLATETTIGRDFDGDGLRAFDSSVSRTHATITRSEAGWFLRDLESANGTFREETAVIGSVELHDGDRIQFGTIAVFFLDPLPEMPAIDVELLSGYTERTPAPGTMMRLDKMQPALPPLVLRLDEPSGGGGGVLAIDGKYVQLTVPQFELLALLIARMTAEQQRNEHERGFVPLAELCTRLSLESSLPREDHVRQLVRRLRRALAKAGIDNLIETRYGVGYRLRGTPSPS